MKIAYYALAALLGAASLLSLLRFGENVMVGNLSGQAFMQLAVGVFLAVIAARTLKRARAS